MLTRQMTLLVIIGAVLLVGGFLVTPGTLVGLNFDYRSYIEETTDLYSGLVTQSSQISKQIQEIEQKTVAVSGQATLAVDKTTTAALSEQAAELVAHSAILRNQLKDIQSKLTAIDSKRAMLRADTQDTYLIVRALCLGAIGSVIMLLTKYVSSAPGKRFFDVIDYGRTLASMAIGSIVSVVTFGLFYTKQISIFDPTEAGATTPAPWRVTIICLLAGVFADKIFEAASQRLAKYLKSDVLTQSSRHRRRRPISGDQ
jgi:hypothetical protein